MESFPWSNFRWAEAHIHFARAIGAIRTGDTDAARKEVEELMTIHAALAGKKTDYDWAKQVDIERQIAAAWLAFADGKKDEALSLMRAAADLDDATDKHPVTPGQLLPAREQLGELLLDLNQASSALREFEVSLQSAPNRFNGLYGAARAAKLAGDQNRARSYYEKLLAISRAADTSRPELVEAKAFLANAGTAARR
jgi:tetratricopeptide (TPR) repeat protein